MYLCLLAWCGNLLLGHCAKHDEVAMEEMTMRCNVDDVELWQCLTDTVGDRD